MDQNFDIKEGESWAEISYLMSVEEGRSGYLIEVSEGEAALENDSKVANV